MMKKIFAGLMAAVMSIMTVGCRNQNKDNTTSTEPMEGTVTSTTDVAIDATNQDGKPVSDGSVSTDSATSAKDMPNEAQNTKSQEKESKPNTPVNSQNASGANKNNGETTASSQTTTAVSTTVTVNATLPVGEVEDLDQYEQQPVTEPTTEEKQNGPVFDKDGSEEL